MKCASPVNPDCDTGRKSVHTVLLTYVAGRITHNTIPCASCCNITSYDFKPTLGTAGAIWGSMKLSLTVTIAAVMSLTLGLDVRAVEEVTRVINAGGNVSSSSKYISFGAVGQGCTVGAISNPTHLANSGFYASFIMFPHLDNNGNGICDEDDPDDDSDGIPDAVELAGTLFSPRTPTDMMNADTDGDGVNDYFEYLSGMNPVSADSQIRITGLKFGVNTVTVQWKACGNTTYYVIGAKTPVELTTNPGCIHTVTTAQGNGPWNEVLAEYTMPGGTPGSCGYFKVKLAEM